MKYVGAAEFKAHCLRLMAEVQAGGEPITVTRRGKPVAVVNAPAETEAIAAKPLASSFGLFKSSRYRFDIEPEESALDPDWEANNPSEPYEANGEKTDRRPCPIRTCSSG